MFDAASMPYEANVSATAEAVAFGHRHGLMESELGTVGGKDGALPLSLHEPGARTNPDEAVTYVDATRADALAVAVGSAHAMRDRTARIDHELIARLRSAVQVPLVLHGSSRIPDDELCRAVAGGLVKVNIGTALNVAFTDAVRTIVADAAVTDPRRYLTVARDAMTDVVAHFVDLVRPAQCEPFHDG